MISSRIVLALAILSAISLSAAAQSCDLVAAALASVDGDSANTILVDRTVMGVPTFAFNAYTGMQRGDTAMARVAEPQLRAANTTRLALPACLAAGGWTTVSDSALFAIFSPTGRRWPGFHEQFPKAKQFALVSQPIVVGDTATIYVATAAGDLRGRGVILRFVRNAEGRWLKQSEVQLWVS